MRDGRGSAGTHFDPQASGRIGALEIGGPGARVTGRTRDIPPCRTPRCSGPGEVRPVAYVALVGLPAQTGRHQLGALRRGGAGRAARGGLTVARAASRSAPDLRSTTPGVSSTAQLL